MLQISVGVTLILFNKQIGSGILKAQNALWKLGYDNVTPNRVACVLVGVAFIILGGLDIAGVTRLR